MNSGAEVVAADNIVVLGSLRGLAHAGAKGNTKAIIAAGKLDTAQIRIANIVREFDRDEEPLRKEVYVYINDVLALLFTKIHPSTVPASA